MAAEHISTTQIKELAKVTNDLRTHLGLPAYTKQTLIRKTSTEKTKESKSENSSERESSNNESKIAMKTKKHRLTTMNNKEAVLYGGRVLLLLFLHN